MRTGDAPSHFLSRPERKCEGAQWQFAPSAALALLNTIAYIKQCSYAVVCMIPITAATHIPRCRHLAWDSLVLSVCVVNGPYNNIHQVV